MKVRKVVLVAITDTHHGFLKGAARYAKEHGWHLVADMIITAKIPIGWRGDGILSQIGFRDALAEFILGSGMPAVELSLVRADIPLPRVCGDNPRIGVFGYNDCVAAGVIDAALDAGLPVPEAVAVLGVDNDTVLAESSAVPISSVRHDLEEVAYRAAALLDSLMDGQAPPPDTIRVAPRGVVTRRSTEILAVDDLRVARALRFLHDPAAIPAARRARGRPVTWPAARTIAATAAKLKAVPGDGSAARS